MTDRTSMTPEAAWAAGPTPPAVWRALGTVRDPELDQAITDLEFVLDVEVEGDEVTVALRLPTYFCAPNFAFLMVADTRAAIESLPGVARAHVSLVDHYASSEINEGMAADRGFGASFEGQAVGDDLEELRDTFTRKGFLARTHELCEDLLSAGHTPEDLAVMTLGELAPSSFAERFIERRRELGMPTDPDSPLLLDVWGMPVAADRSRDHLRRARTVHVSIEGNASLCRGLLAARYAEGGTGDDLARRAYDPLATSTPTTSSTATAT
jgi:metal-sulfur cluster biosynthetic enzyme